MSHVTHMNESWHASHVMSHTHETNPAEHYYRRHDSFTRAA